MSQPTRICPLRMIMCDSEFLVRHELLERNAPVAGIPPSPLCLEKLCQWWDGDQCIICNIGVFLAGISDELQTMRNKIG